MDIKGILKDTVCRVRMQDRAGVRVWQEAEQVGSRL